MKSINDVVYLLDITEEPITSLPTIYDLEIENVFQDVRELTFKIPIEQKIIVEQQIYYRNKKYIITEIEELKTEQKTAIVADSLFIELNGFNVEVYEIEGVTLVEAARKIASQTNWEIGEIEFDDKHHSMSEENKSALYLFEQLATIADFEVEFDVKNRLVNYRKSIGKDLQEVFRYRKNLKEIKKTTFAPKLTEITPVGRGGLKIGGVNDDQDYVEDYSWYESLGLSVSDARKRFRKSQVWKDDRFIHAGNLMREGERKLRTLAHPQISYETTVSFLNKDARVGDFGYVVDDELGIKVKVRLVRIVEYENTAKNTVEFNYLIPGLQDSNVDSDSSGGRDGGSELILANNRDDITVEDTFEPIIELSFTAYASTNAQLSLLIVGEASEDQLLEGYLSVDGEESGIRIKQNVGKGYFTFNMAQLLTQIQDGSSDLSFYLKNDIGTFEIQNGNAQLYLVAENLLGGVSSESPRAKVLEEVTIPRPFLNVSDSHEIEFKEDGEN